jgi:hypothetical protein
MRLDAHQFTSYKQQEMMVHRFTSSLMCRESHHGFQSTWWMFVAAPGINNGRVHRSSVSFSSS